MLMSLRFQSTMGGSNILVLSEPELRSKFWTANKFSGFSIDYLIRRIGKLMGTFFSKPLAPVTVHAQEAIAFFRPASFFKFPIDLTGSFSIFKSVFLAVTVGVVQGKELPVGFATASA